MAGKAKQGLFLEGGIIAMTLGTSAATIGHITRNCVNPAVEIGLNVVNYVNNHDHLTKIWLYIVAPIVGGLLAAFITRLRKLTNTKTRRLNLTLN